MADEFVALGAYLHAPEFPAAVEEEPSETEVPVEGEPMLGEIVSQMRRFRAALYDAFATVRGRLLSDIACEVVGRELQLAPADIEAIVRRACAQAEAPTCVRVHPLDAPAFSGWTCDVETDTALRRGDVVLCVRDGTIEAALGTRLEGVLEAATCT